MNSYPRIPPGLMSEASIQAHFFQCCWQIGLNCALELTTEVGRIDAGLFSNNWQTLLAIVECKYFKHDPWAKMKRTEQIDRYKQLGVPVYGLSDMNKCLSLAETIQRNGHQGIAWQRILTSAQDNKLRTARVKDVELLGRYKSIPAVKLIGQLVKAEQDAKGWKN